jgi:hypothetical protein
MMPPTPFSFAKKKCHAVGGYHSSRNGSRRGTQSSCGNMLPKRRF